MSDRPSTKAIVWTIIGILVFLVLCIGALGPGCSAYNRYQKRANANNRVQVTHIEIKNAQQQAQVVEANNAAVRARAEQRYLEAVGIRRAQDEISKTLTPLYIQHEAIQAQEHALNQGNAQIYIPSGNQGVPLVQTTNVPGK